jgi:hypothetical protein
MQINYYGKRLLLPLIILLFSIALRFISNSTFLSFVAFLIILVFTKVSINLTTVNYNKYLLL